MRLAAGVANFLYSCVDAVQVIRPFHLLSCVSPILDGVSAVQII